MHHYRLEIFNTDLRWICLLRENDILRRLTFYHDTATAAKAMVETEIGHSVSLQTNATPLARALTKYAKGERISFSDIPTCASRTSFQQKVLSCCQQIPYGCTMTYGEIAKQVGHVGAARAVGGVMRTNNCPLVVPCHRVLGSNGKLTGFSAGTGLGLKRRLLQMEGINQKIVF